MLYARTHVRSLYYFGVTKKNKYLEYSYQFLRINTDLLHGVDLDVSVRTLTNKIFIIIFTNAPKAVYFQ